MNKEEILEKSRIENKNLDLFEREVSQKAGNLAAIVAAILATVFYVIQVFVGLGQNYGLYAVVFSIPATGYLVKAFRMKNKKTLSQQQYSSCHPVLFCDPRRSSHNNLDYLIIEESSMINELVLRTT